MNCITLLINYFGAIVIIALTFDGDNYYFPWGRRSRGCLRIGHFHLCEALSHPDLRLL